MCFPIYGRCSPAFCRSKRSEIPAPTFCDIPGDQEQSLGITLFWDVLRRERCTRQALPDVEATLPRDGVNWKGEEEGEMAAHSGNVPCYHCGEVSGFLCPFQEK